MRYITEGSDDWKYFHDSEHLCDRKHTTHTEPW